MSFRLLSIDPTVCQMDLNWILFYSGSFYESIFFVSYVTNYKLAICIIHSLKVVRINESSMSSLITSCHLVVANIEKCIVTIHKIIGNIKIEHDWIRLITF